MAKKRQSDFQKTNLKVGRPAGRRRNITSTAFKAKKIIVNSKAPKPKSEKSITEILSKIKSPNSSSAIKSSYLKELLFLVEDKEETLKRNLCEVLDSVLPLTVDTDEKVKKLCVDILGEVFVKTEDIHLHNYVDRITRTIVCLMKSSSPSSKDLSLSLLDSMLQHHSNLIVHCMSILNCLVGLVNFTKRKHHHTYTGSSNLGAMSSGSKNVYSPRFQINIMGHMNFFLQELLKKMTKEEAEQEFLDGFYNRKERYMCWTTVPKGGCRRQWYTQKNDYVKVLDLQNPYFVDSGAIEQFIDDFATCVSSVYIEEMASVTVGDDNIIPRETIKNLNILFEAFSKVCEWAKLVPYTGANTPIKKFLGEHIFNGKAFPFYTTSSIGGGIAQYPPCVELNIALCYLCLEYLVEPGKMNDMCEDIFRYLKTVLAKSEKVMPYEVKYKSIPMMIKIIEICLKMANDPEVSDFLNTCIDHLCNLIRIDAERDNQKQLVSFLMKTSVNPDYYSFVAQSRGMKVFFSWLLRKLKEENSELDKKYLKTIKKLANFKYPNFYQALAAQNANPLKSLLKNDDYDVRDTAIAIIYHMEELSDTLLDELARVILTERRFPKEDAIRLIRLLICRFFDKAASCKDSTVYSPTGFVNFTMFIITLALDLHNMTREEMIDFDRSEYSEGLKRVRNSHPFDLIPSLRWEEHEEIFELSLNTLKRLPHEHVTEMLMKIMNDALEGCSSLPIHCAIAMMRLDDERIMTFESYRTKMCDLTFSCLMTLNILTQEPHMDDEWYQWNINALRDSIEISRETTLQILESVEDKRYGECTEENESFVIYNFCTIFKFFLTQGLLSRSDAERLSNLLDYYAETCSKNVMRQPLFQELSKLLKSL